MLIDAIRSIMRGQGVDLPSLLMQLLATAAILFLILPLHEYAHGLVAYKLGDQTAKRYGRLTLNPLASLDPMGTLGIVLFGIGWAKPVPVNPLNFRNPKRDMAITALAGPVSNILAAFVGAFLYNLLFCFAAVIPGNVLIVLNVFFYYYISINLSLAVFNLLPAPPLDGSRIVAAFLPNRMAYQYYRYERYIVLILFALLFIGALDPVLSFLHGHFWNAVMWLASLPFEALGLL